MPPLIRRPRGLTNAQISVGVAVGVLCGFYVWQPLLQKYIKQQKITKED
jgi:hypothetical protein